MPSDFKPNCDKKLDGHSMLTSYANWACGEKQKKSSRRGIPTSLFGSDVPYPAIIEYKLKQAIITIMNVIK